MGRLDGKHALVTGGATGIGGAISRAFVAEGARVVIAARDAGRARAFADGLGEPTGWRQLDIRDADAWAELARDFASDPLDVLVNNAGGLIHAKRLHEIEPAEWRDEVETNLSGAFYGMRAFLPQMLARGRGSIINIASISGIRGQADAAAYQAAKGGLRMLTKNAAYTYGPSGVRINTIDPGAIDTEAVAAEPAERLEPFLARTPMRRQGTPAEVAAVAVFLASDDASFVTGADYVVDGGYTI